jgi:hypothetical protein
MLKSAIQFKTVILFVSLLLFLTQIIAAPVITKHTKISASFDSELKLNHGYDENIIILSGAPTIIANGKNGDCLHLGSNGSIAISGSNFGTISEGTFMFWMRPNWNNNQGVSHTFFGMNLNNGYMVLSDGWWEDYDGANILYFIANNSYYLDNAKTDSEMPFKKNNWYHIIVTFNFNAGENSFSAMYVNGILLSKGFVDDTVTTPVTVNGNLIIGSSVGINGETARYADADYDDFVFLDKALNDNEALAEYNLASTNEVVLHFDKNIQELKIDEGTGSKHVTVIGNPQIIDDGIIGKCIRLNQGDYITFDAKHNIGEFNESTIMFWVRPHWTNNQSVSHTFWSMNLDGDGYMILSDGWWEDNGGNNQLYAIANNQFGAYICKDDNELVFNQGNWYHIAMVSRFDGADNSFYKLYVNGELIDTETGYAFNLPGKVSPLDIMQLGSSYNINDNAYRYADADFDEFSFSTRITLGDEIKTIYNNQKGGALKIVAHLDKSAKIDSANNDTLTNIGWPTIDFSDISNYCVSLDIGDALKLEANNNLGDFSAGTVMFWIRPHSSNNQGISNTLFGMNLNDGYMVLSDGWWGDHNEFYGIADNMFYLYGQQSDSLIPLEAGEWYHIAMSFDFDNETGYSYNWIYINGQLVAQGETDSVIGAVAALDTLKLGDGSGLYDDNPRWANADYTEFKFFTRNLSSEEIINNYRLKSPFKLYYRDIYTIADDNYDPPRNVNGVIRESRILLDEAGSYSTKAAAEELVNKAKNAGFNIIMTCVFMGDGSRYHTDFQYNGTDLPMIEKYDHYIDGKDPLQYLIDYAHSKDIDVHAWFGVNYCASYKGTGIEALYRSHNWLDDNYTNADGGVHFVNIHHSNFGDYISDMILDCANKYNIDGLTLDYIRARCFFVDSYSINDYQAKYSRNLTDDLQNKAYSYISDWNYNAVTSIVTKVHDKIKNYDQDIIISICGATPLNAEINTGDYAIDGRDGKRWVNADLIDFTLAMAYERRPDYNKCKQWISEFTTPYAGRAGLIIGNYDMIDNQEFVRDAGYTATLLSFAQRVKNSGIVACYYYGGFSSDQSHAIKNGPFKATAVPYYK